MQKDSQNVPLDQLMPLAATQPQWLMFTTLDQPVAHQKVD